jgi:type VI secretion system protein VasJ
MADTSLAKLGTDPVPGETPAGADARYEPEYAAVLDEIEKLSFSGQGATVSWPVIEKNAILILAEKSKDIQIAAYLGVALEQTRGLAGMRDGIAVLTGILENFWESAWPALKRMRGRVNALDWWHERSAAFLQECEAKSIPAPAPLLDSLQEALSKLDALVGELMPDATPLRDLVAVVKRLPVEATPEAPPEAATPAAEIPASAPPAPPAEAQAAPSPTAPAAEVAAPAPTPAAVAPTPAPAPVSTTSAQPPPAAPEELPKLRRQFAESGLAYLAVARLAQPADAALWRLSRLIIWGPIVALPAADNGQTLLPAPDMGPLQQARQKLQAGDALGAALEAEEFFLTAPVCLTAQEIIHTALTALGPGFASAAAVAREGTAAFVKRLPGMEKLAFTDGTPFLAPESLPWLRAALAPPREGAGAARAGEADPALAKAVAEATELAAQQKLSEALAVLDAAKTASPAANLRLAVRQARLMLDAGRAESAQALAEALLEACTAQASGRTWRQNLDDWDPSLALEALLVVREAFALNPERYADSLPALRRRIARLSAASALE